MRKGIFLSILSVVFLVFQTSSVVGAELLALNFQQKGEISELELILDANEVKAKKFQVTEDKQIIIDLEGVTSTERAMRAFDTSEFSGSVVFVSAYKKPGPGNNIRVALQLRDNVRSILKRRPNRLVLQVENRFGVLSQNELSEGEVREKKDVLAQENVGKLLVPKSDSVEDILTNLTLSGRKKYIGKKITVNFSDASVEDVLKIIAEASGLNIITTKEIGGLPRLSSLNLTNVPWDQALDTILGLNKLVAKKNGTILMVTTLATATAEQEAELKAKALARGQEPLVTRVFPISYATTADIGKILQDYLTPERGRIALDERTNSIIVRDTAEIIEKMGKIIDVLDAQTPQVLIEGKVVEVDEDYRKQIGLTNGLQFGYDPVGSLGDTLPSAVGGDLTAGADGGPGFSFNSAPTIDAPGLFGLSIARFGRLVGLNFELQLLESESKVRIVSTPKVIAQNNKKATLNATDTTSFTNNIVTGDESQTGFSEAQQQLVLEVTPQVTNEGSISMDIIIQKERFGARPTAAAPPDKTSRRAETSVLVNNGSTIVIGGLYEFSEIESHSGVPFLKDLPLVGWLFRTPKNPQKAKREMIIFITPRIINQEEAGLGSEGA